MSNTYISKDDEIDLFDFFATLWAGRGKIVATAVAAGLIGLVFGFFKPSAFDISSIIRPAPSNVFIDYISINEILKSNGLASTEENTGGYVIDNTTVFKLIIAEFNDYEEMVAAVEQSAFVQQSLDELNPEDRARELLQFAKSFKIAGNFNPETNWRIQIRWHSAEEAIALFETAMNAVLLNVKKTLQNDVVKLASSLDAKNLRNREKLEVQLNAIVQRENEVIAARIAFLSEQAAIARELDIETNQINGSSISLSLDLNANARNGVKVHQQGDNSIPFYLRGYRAIDKEISLLQNRSDELRLMMASDYAALKGQLARLEGDLSGAQLRDSARIIAKDDANHWVEFNMRLEKPQSRKKPLLYISLAMFLGGMAGGLYVMISHIARKREDQSANL